MSPGCAAVWSTERDEMAHTTRAVQLLDVVASDQSALRVTHEIDALAPEIVSELFDSVGDDVSEFLYRPCVEAAEEASEVDAMRAISQPNESSCQPADDTRCNEEAMHEKHRSLTAVPR